MLTCKVNFRLHVNPLMRGRGYTTLKGRQVQISVYLPPRQYWSLRAATTKTGLSIQDLMRRALEQVVREARLSTFGPSPSVPAEAAPRPKVGAAKRRRQD